MTGDRIGYIVALKDSTWPRQQELNIENQHQTDADEGENTTGRRLLEQTGTRYAIQVIFKIILPASPDRKTSIASLI